MALLKMWNTFKSNKLQPACRCPVEGEGGGWVGVEGYEVVVVGGCGNVCIIHSEAKISAAPDK